MNSKETKPGAVVVNGDPAQLAVLAGLLAKAGIEARAFESAEAALAAMDPADPPDLVVTDIYMPGIDGWRFCRLLRSPEYSAFNEVPILLVSATFAGDHPERIAADVGADTFLPSPVDGNAFVARVRALLTGKDACHPPRALIVEDGRTLAELLKKTFAAHGFRADTVLTAHEAAAAFDRTPYNVAVLDHHLPDGTGDELLNTFRMRQPDCVCLMMTTDPTPELALDWMKRGAAAYLRKPFDPELLIELCARVRRERALLRAEDLLQARTRELRESEERYRNVFAAMPDGIWVYGADGVILDANETLCRRIELSREALIGRNVREFIPAEGAAKLGGNLRDVPAGQPFIFESTHLSTTGKAVEIEVHERRIPWGGRTAVLGISRDITDRKRVEAEHERARAMLQSALAQSPAGILIADAPDVTIRWANPAALGIRGESRLPLTGIGVGRHADHWQTFRPDGRPYPSEELPLSRAVLKGEITCGEELVIRHASGEERWVFVNAAPIRDPAGAIIAGIVVFTDITERKRAEEAERVKEADRGLNGRIATAAIHAQDLARFQEELLPLLGEALDVSRTYVFMYCHDTKTMDNTAEWTARGVTPQKDNLQGIPADMEWWWIATLMRGEAIEFADVGEIPDRRTIETLRSQDIRAILVIPLFIGTRYCGFMGLDECRRNREWTPRERDLLTEAVHILMGVWADEELRQNEERFRGILRDVATVAVQGYAKDGTVRYWNRASEVFYGHTAEEVTGRNLLDLIIPPAMRDEVRAAMRRMAETGETVPASELALMRKDGSLISVYSSHALVRVPGQDVELFCIDIDITARKRMEEMLQQTNRLLSAVVDQSPIPMAVVTSNDNRIRFFNGACLRFLGVSDADFTGRRLQDIDWNWVSRTPEGVVVPPEESPIAKALRGEAVHAQMIQLTDRQGNVRWCETEGVPIHDAAGNLIAGLVIFPDITSRKQAEVEREKLQAQLMQAQKMESVGRLAGGVAHDFNNMLGVILGHAELSLEKVGPGEPLHAGLEEIRSAAQRSADLTRQLLAFARKQTVMPRVVDLNNTVESMLKLLRRLIGEDIDLVWKPGRELWPVRVDPTQIDQVLANLCVNARDAITGGGKVTIKTENTAFDEDYCALHAGFVPGDYVLLVVSDDGCGMDAETLSHLFEPFFTTKEMGRGTGLGLATVYGAVKQNNGFVTVHSEPGQGTAFKIYLPRHLAGTAHETAKRRPQSAARGSETILLVEDEPAILRITTMMLEQLEYTVLGAHTPGEAIRLAREHSGRIDLLLSDVVMPEMNGRDLAQNLLSIHPDIRRLFMSGYTADVIAHRGVLDKGVHFLQKPFSVKDLGAKIREVLEA